MLRTFRRLRLGQIALGIASILAVTGSLGLHPEPAVARSQAAPAGLPRWDATPVSDGASHDCLACLAHRSLSLSRLSGVVLQPGICVTLSFCPRNDRPPAAPARAHAGRSPPAST